MKLNNYPYYEMPNLNNFKEMLEYNKNTIPRKIAFSYKLNDIKVSKTFLDVYNDVKYCSNYFYENYKNEHIGLIGENSYNYLIIFLSIVLSGNICVIFDKDADSKKLNTLFKNSDTKIVYYSEKYCSDIENLRLIKSFPIDNISKYFSKSSNKDYEIDNDKDAVIFFTSGTVGANKAVVLSQKNIMSDIIGASSLYKPLNGGGVVSFLPFHHALGLITSVLMSFNYGVETFITSSLKNILSDIKNEKPETIFAVPLFIETFYKSIWKTAKKNKQEKKLKLMIKFSNFLLKFRIDKRKVFFKSIHQSFGGNLSCIICGGAFLDILYIKWFRSIGIEILNGYGITECSPVVAVNRPFYKKDGSVGVACKDVEVKIIDGEICVKGQNVMKGYYKDEYATSKVIKNGYFYTGDLGYIDNNGFIFITGRKKNLIILSNGENVSPEVIENELKKDKGVCEIVVYEEAKKIVAQIYPNDEYLNNQEYFDKLIYNYNKDKAKNMQIAYVKLRSSEFEKNSNKKIIRVDIGKEK